MALKDIENKIIYDADLKAESIISDAQAKAEDIIRAAEEEAGRYSDMALKDASEQGKREQVQALSIARLASRDKMLSMKQGIISEVYTEALSDMGKSSKADHEKMLLKILSLTGPLPQRVNVSCPKGKAKQTEDIFKKAKSELKLKTDFRFADKPIASSGGFKLSTDDMEIDGTFEGFLSGIKKDIEPEIVKVLFGEEK